MSKLHLPNYTVIKDTREKEGHGWVFEKHHANKKPPRCDGTIVQKLNTGDYSLVGYEDVLAIERKNSFSELWGNFGEKDRIEDVMGRLCQIKNAYILIESCITNDHFELSPPQYRVGVPGKALIRWVISLGIEYNVKVIPVGQCGKKYAQLIFEEVIRTEKDRWIR